MKDRTIRERLGILETNVMWIKNENHLIVGLIAAQLGIKFVPLLIALLIK